MISEETKILIASAVANLQQTIFNLLCHAKRNPDSDDFRLLRNLVLGLPDRICANHREEIEFIETIPIDDLPKITFPYPRKQNADKPICECGMDKGLPFVVHNGKRLFFPIGVTADGARESYRGYIETEGLLGTGALAKSPHAYVSDSFKVDSGDVLLDVGCAEALFALDNAEKASQIYLFEFLRKWRKPLSLTFAPYKHKTHLIPKFVSGHTDSKSIRLVDALPPCGNATYFIKMDIEGNERFVLESSRDFLKANKVKLACCVYHRQDDADYISKLLTGLGYSVSFSDGYMLPTLNGIHFPYFRKGVIRAKNF